MNKFTKVLLSVPLLLSTVACSSAQSNEYQSDNHTIETHLEYGVIQPIADLDNGFHEVNIYGPKGVDYTNFKCNGSRPVYMNPNDTNLHDTRMNGDQFTEDLLQKFCSVSKSPALYNHMLWGF